MRWLSISVSLFVAAIFSGCAVPLAPNEYRINISSEPSGAYVYSGQTALGVTPISGTMKLSPEQVNSTTHYAEVVLHWASGNRSNHKIIFNPRENQVWSITLSRPPNLPGLDADIAAAQKQRVDAEARKSSADALTAGVINALSQGFISQQQPATNSYAPSPKTTCISRSVFGRLETVCE